ncbi:MAG TPA: L-seryl-tRNA(Sec) selenium transferase [Ilumatobacteraceae bacterium]|nr:L-seryl-tRNA(Sec) selenium transferase [Ilumatobacteraceae bacterium]
MPESPRPPSVDRLARQLGEQTTLPHALCVDVARRAIASGDPGDLADHALADARAVQRLLQSPAINATGVLLHTNLGRAPYALQQPAHASTVEFDVDRGERGSRQRGVNALISRLVGTEAAMVVNNNAAAVLLVLAAVAAGRGVTVSRGESVEIGGGFRVPEVLTQSGARLIDVGTTNRTRLSDYRQAIQSTTAEIAAVLKVHPSNYRVTGFTETTSTAQLATLDVPLIVDIGSGLIDETCPWLPGPPPAWLDGEPGARQTIAEGADVITFSGDKLFGGPQAGIIAGRAQIVTACMQHPLARALRPGGHILAAVEAVAMSYLRRSVTVDLPFWQMASATLDDVWQRAAAIAPTWARVVGSEAVAGAGSVPGLNIASAAIELPGDHLAALRSRPLPIIARVRDAATVLDLRSVLPTDDAEVAVALAALTP